jgi:hypothetical protein
MARIRDWMMGALAALALSVDTGCGDAAERRIVSTPQGDVEIVIVGHGQNAEGQEIECTGVEPGEERFTGFDGYNPAGCSRTERMADVRPWQNEDGGHQGQHEEELAQVQQPITVGAHVTNAVAITVNGSQQITGFRGECPVDLSWTTNQPLRGNCLIPDVPSAIDWAVCPSCYTQEMRDFMRFRMFDAWDVWRRTPTQTACAGTSNAVTRTTSIKSTNSSEEKSFSSSTENYDNAKIVVYPVSGIFAGARMGVDKDFLLTRTPIRNGIRYHSWQYAALEVDHQIIESVKLPDCVSATDPQREAKKINGYVFILAHELGHGWGLAHQTTGLMKRGSLQSCSDVFSANNSTARNMPSFSERQTFVSLKDSSGFSVHPDAANCGTPTTPDTSTPDDMAVVNF